MKHLKTIMSVLVIFAAVSCAKTPSAGSGQVSFEVASDYEIVEMTRSNVSDYTTALPASADFTITVTGPYSWTGKISEWDAATVLPAGEYSVTAEYGSLEGMGFDKPYFTGTANFTVAGGQTTAVSIPVKLGNTVVKLQFTDNFNNYYKDYSFTLTSQGNDIVFAKGETRAAFVDGWRVTLSGTYTKEFGDPLTFSKEYSALEAATAYTFVFDVTNVGGATLSVTFKDGYGETVELGDQELND